MFPAKRNRCDHILDIARNHHADGYLTVVRSIHRVEGTASGIEADFSTQVAAEGGMQSGGIEGRGFSGVRENREVILHQRSLIQQQAEKS